MTTWPRTGDARTPASPVVIVGDKPEARAAIRRIVEGMGLPVFEAPDGVEAMRILEHEGLRRRGSHGLALLGSPRQAMGQTPVILLAASAPISDRAPARRSEAVGYWVTPFETRELRATIEAVLAQKTPAAAVAVGNNPVGQKRTVLIGSSPALRDAFEKASQVAPTDATVLLLGESGTGKDVVARLIHGFSSRSDAPLVTVDCGAVPEGLVESELFGHARGAFTDAVDARAGRFLEANDGTLFLDEISELPWAVQAKLLRVLQERTVRPLGGTKQRAVNARIIAASNRDLQALVKEGRFRGDLFFRLNVVPIVLPALRDRPGDVSPLAQHFLASANRRLQKRVVLSEAALLAMQLYGWPGNVRELENSIERMTILNRTGVIGLDDLPPAIRSAACALPATVTEHPGDEAIDLPTTLARIETALIGRALRISGGNKTQAAKLLGLRRSTFLDKLKRISG